MISVADVKTNVTQEIKELLAISCNFYKNCLQNLKHNTKQICTFHLTLVDIPFSFIVFIKNRGWGFI